MPDFNSLAKSLTSKPTSQLRNSEGGDKAKLERGDLLLELAASGFDLAGICAKLEDLYTGCEDDSIRRQLLDMVLKVQGMYKEAEAKQAPKFVFNIVGELERFNEMICPKENAA